MNKYTTIDELRSAKRRLYVKKEELESEMKENVTSLKNSLTPAGLLGLTNLGSSHNGSSSNKQNSSVLSGMAGTSLDLIVHDLFLRRSSYFKKFMMSYFMRMIAPILMRNAGPVINKLVRKSGILNYFSKSSSRVVGE